MKRRIAGIAIGAWPTTLAAQVSTATRQLGGGGGVDVSLGRIVVSLVICSIVAVLAVLLIRQRAGKGDLAAIFSRLEPRGRTIDIIETRRLSPHADACLLRHHGREYLLVLQHSGIVVLRDEAIGAIERGAPSCDGGS